MEALLLVNKEARAGVINALAYPLYTQVEEIDKVIRKYKSEDKYQEIIKLYFDGRGTTVWR